MKIHPIIANNPLQNIFYIIEYADKQALIIDPCNAELTKSFLQEHDLKLEKVFITHEHYDHYDGVEGLNCNQVYAGEIATNNMPITVHHIFRGQDIIFECEEFSFKAIASPGHAAGHMMFELSEKQYVGNAGMRSDFVSVIFSGDVLFQGGVGHTRNGSSSDLYNSVKLFEKYSDEVMIYSGHDYLEGNMQFAEVHCPKKYVAMKALKNSEEDIFFTNLLQERGINPFVGVSLEEFTRLRELKNNF